MTTYTDEVNIYNPEAVGEGIESASQTATNYIGVDSTGIRIANANPSTATTYQHQTATETEFVVDGTGMAEFGGSGARIGAANAAHVEVHSDSLLYEDVNSARLISMTTYPDTTVYNHMTFTADGVTTRFDVESSQRISLPARSFSGALTLLDGVPTNKALLNYSAGLQSNTLVISGVRFNSADDVPSGTVIDLYVSSNTHSHLQIGSRLYSTSEEISSYGTNSLGIGSCWATGDGSLAAGLGSSAEGFDSVAFSGGHASGNASIAACSGYAYGERAVAIGFEARARGTDSRAFGYYAYARADNQTVIGKANVEDRNGDYALIIGNGTGSNTRSNAAAITWLGEYIAQGWAGVIQMFGGSTPPAGWLLCDGSAVSRTEYAVLFAAIGTTWGAGDGSTTFNLPDLRGRAPIGAGTGSGLTARTLGDSVGVETHAHGGKTGSHTLTAAESGNQAQTITSGEMSANASHSHQICSDTDYKALAADGNVGEHSVNVSGTLSGSKYLYVSSGVDVKQLNSDNTQSKSVAHTHEVKVAAKAATSGHDHTISSNSLIQPSAVVNFIIHTGKTS